MDVDVTPLPVEPAELIQHWRLVRHGLKEIIVRFPQRWIPEDVYMQVKLGNAELVMFQKEGRSIGFFVGAPTLTLFMNERQYFLWAIWRAPKATVTKANRYQAIDIIKARARHFQCSEITFGTARKGFHFYGAEDDYQFCRMKL